MSSVSFFPADADRETASIWKIAYEDIADVSVDRLWYERNMLGVVLTRKNGGHETFGVWSPDHGNIGDYKVVERAGQLLQSRWKAATPGSLPAAPR